MLKMCSGKFHEGDRLIPTEMFGRLKTAPDGLNHKCKKCINLWCKTRRKNLSESEKTQDKKVRQKYYTKTKVKHMARARRRYYELKDTSEGHQTLLLYAAKARAKKKGIDFDIDKDDIIIPEICPILGIPLEKNMGNAPHENSPTIDRINPKLGYVKGNVIVISFRANCIKGYGTPEEHLKIYEFFKDIT